MTKKILYRGRLGVGKMGGWGGGSPIFIPKIQKKLSKIFNKNGWTNFFGGSWPIPKGERESRRSGLIPLSLTKRRGFISWYEDDFSCSAIVQTKKNIEEEDKVQSVPHRFLVALALCHSRAWRFSELRSSGRGRRRMGSGWGCTRWFLSWSLLIHAWRRWRRNMTGQIKGAWAG